MTPIQHQILAVLERFIEAHKASSELRRLIPSDAPVDHDANELIIELHHTVMVLEEIATHYGLNITPDVRAAHIGSNPS